MPGAAGTRRPTGPAPPRRFESGGPGWPRVLFIGAVLLLAAVTDTAAGMEIRHARGFRVEIFADHTLVTVKPARRAGAAAHRYLLVPRGQRPPGHHPPAQVVAIPVRRVAALSTTYLAYMDDAGLVDRLVGLSRFKHVNTPSVRRRIEAGDLLEVGTLTSLRIEALLELDPDLILTSGTGSAFDLHPKLMEAGLNTALVLDHLEADPLARCEWLKFLALFFDTGAHAEALFDAVEDRYLRLVEKTAPLDRRPEVFTGAPFRGQWWVPLGGSFVARFIRDAGGDYVWADTPGTGSRAMDIEAVYERALDADVWIDSGTWKTLDDALAADPRFGDLKAYRSRRVYNNNKRLNRWGGNDYWESGMIRPDVVLADLIKILHPRLVPDHRLVYYRRLGAGDGRVR